MIGVFFVPFLLLSFGAVASTENMYQKHNVSFQIPANWSVTKDIQIGNDTLVMLNNSSSSIRIDIFNVDNNTWNDFKPLYWNKSSLEYINAEKAVEMYSNCINLNSHKFLSYGIGPSTVAPDGVHIVASWADYGITLRNGTLIKPKSIIWLIAWTKPEYKNKIVGIYGNITGSYPEHDYYPDGARIPQPIWDVLDSIHVLVDPMNVKGAYGSDHWDFEGDIGQGWHFEGTPQWLIDCNERHTGSCSMRSGEVLPFSGPTSIWREIQGPVILTFWWKADSIQVCTDPSVMCKGLFFLVDGKTQLTCNSADWKEVRFPLADGLHRVEWIFKPRSDQKGIGWLDNVSIAPTPVTAYTNHSLDFKIPKGWSVVKDLEDNNDTQIVVSDSMSSIRIDILRAGFILNLPAGEGYGTNEYNSYKNNIAKAQKHMCLEGGGIPLRPDGADVNAGVSCDEEDGLAEWVLLWTKPGYGDRLIGVHALLRTIYPTTKIQWGGHGYMETYIQMAEPLHDLLGNITLRVQ